MEHQAQKQIKLGDGREVTVRALKTKDVANVGSSVATVLISFDMAKGNLRAAFDATSKPVVDAVIEVLSLCTSLNNAEVGSLPLGDTLKLIDAWSDVNKLEEIAPTFLSLGRKWKNFRKNKQRPSKRK